MEGKKTHMAENRRPAGGSGRKSGAGSRSNAKGAPQKRPAGKQSKAALEAKRKKAKQKKRRRIALFVAEFFVVIILAAVLYVVLKLDRIDREEIKPEDILINNEVSGLQSLEGYKNVALFGVDISKGNNLGKGARTDTIMIASLNEKTGEVKLVSVYRDTYLNIGNDTYNKANSAYAKGGPKQAINMLNQCLDLNITDYVTIDFRALTDTINELGGIEIDVQADEIEHLNNYQIGTQEVTGGDIVNVTSTGLQTLNGLQATAYCRIRYTAGDDYKRTERQRTVLAQVAKKAKTAGVGTLNKIVNKVFDKMSTSFSSAELIGYAANVAKYELGETSGFPFEKKGATIKKASSVVPLSRADGQNGLSYNVSLLHQFLFGEEGYVPSDTVQSIGKEIDASY